MDNIGMMINVAKKFGGGSGAGSGGGSTSGSIPVTTEPNMHLVTDADGKMAWEAKDGGEVVVLEETTLTGEDGTLMITTQFTESLKAGSVYKVTYNGTEYECTGVEVNLDVTAVALGNLSPLGVAGGNDDAPFVIVEYPPELAAEAGISAMLNDLGGASSATISIVDTGKTKAVGSGLIIVRATLTSDSGNITGTIDRGVENIVGALEKGQYVVCYAKMDAVETLYVLPVAAYSASKEEVLFSALIGASETDATIYLNYTANGVTGKMKYLT